MHVLMHLILSSGCSSNVIYVDLPISEVYKILLMYSRQTQSNTINFKIIIILSNLIIVIVFIIIAIAVISHNK